MNEKEEMILNFMKDEDYVPMKAKEMAMVLNISKDRYNELIEVLNKLESDLKIVKNRKNRYRINDEKILKIAPQIAKRVKYRSLILSNLEYNTKYTKDINMNKIKSIMHNKVLYQLVHEEQPEYDYIIVDEFAREARYYGYLTGINDVQRDITFMTKAEDKNLAVACSSIISRYIFLKEFDKLSDSLGIPLVKGAGSEVDKIGEEIVEKYGKEKLKEIAKLNFANTKRILHTMIF